MTGRLPFTRTVAGAPGTAIGPAQTVSPVGELTGLSLFGASEIELNITLPTPVTLAAGTYWIEITTNSVGNTDSVFWEVGDLDPIAGRAGNVFATEVPGVTWNTDVENFAITMCGALALPESQPVPTIGKNGLVIMALMLMLLAGATIRRFS